jgi:type II secretory pathway pseudopilin PulG
MAHTCCNSRISNGRMGRHGLTAKRFDSKAQGREAHPGLSAAERQHVNSRGLRSASPHRHEVKRSEQICPTISNRRPAEYHPQITQISAESGKRVLGNLRNSATSADNILNSNPMGLRSAPPPAIRIALLRGGARNAGMTLVELLVVIGIMLLAVVMFVPRLKPAMDKGRVREAARAVQLYLSSARNQAMATGRSCGVMIEPLPAENGCSTKLSQVETPVPYGGDTLNAVATIKLSATQPPDGFTHCDVTLSSPPSVPLYRGDLVQIGYQGYWLTLGDRNAVNAKGQIVIRGARPMLEARLDLSHGETPAWLYQPAGITGPYKILRWPVKSATASLQLPAPTVIDFTWSGNDPAGNNSSPVWQKSTAASPPTIMFAPDGTVDRICLTINNGAGNVYQAVQVTTPIYLLVGLRNKVFSNPSDPNIATSNLNDLNNLWVSVDPATGLIVVADVAAPPQNPASVQPSDYWSSRAFARQAMANGGGRE